MHCNGNIILEKPLDFMYRVASGFGYPNYRLSELSLVEISSYNLRSTVLECLISVYALKNSYIADIWVKN